MWSSVAIVLALDNSELSSTSGPDLHLDEKLKEYMLVLGEGEVGL